MDAINLLEAQHDDFDALFARLEDRGGRARQQPFDDLADLLAIHASIEELHFYPAVNAARTGEIVEHALEEHLDIKRKLSVCMATSVSSPKFVPRLLALREEVQRHVAEERRELFPKVRQMFDEDQLEALGQEMTSTMAELQKGHPRRDVPLQTLAPMPSLHLPMQSSLGSRVLPHVGRLLMLPMELVGIARQLRKAGAAFSRGVQRGMARAAARKRAREA